MKKTTANDDVTKYAHMGMAALLPGMMHMLDMMQRQIDEFRARLNGAQAQPRRVEGATKLGRPRKNVEAVEGRASSGWPADPEERRAEMRRRQAVAKAKRTAKLHPRDAAHPGHAAWVEKIGKVQRARWKKMTPRERNERLAKMQAGHEMKLAVAS
jgi:hypothetical protein